MSLRKRVWGANGDRTAWVVDFTDASGKRRLKTFAAKKDAERFEGLTKAIGGGQIPEPLTRGYRPIEFTAPIPLGGLRNGIARVAVAEALRVRWPSLEPTTDSVIIHVIAEMPPRHVAADVDNLLKPVLDALKGVAWMDDTQVCELLVRRVPSRRRQLRIKIWQVPGPVFATHLNALAEMGHPTLAKRPAAPTGDEP
jgi:hypothetical protein